MIENSIDSKSLSKHLLEELISEKRKLINSSSPICDICFGTLGNNTRENNVFIEKCSHSFHKNCFGSYIDAEVKKCNNFS